MVIIQKLHKLSVTIILLILISCSCTLKEAYDTIKFSDTQQVRDSINKLNYLFLKLQRSGYAKQNNYGFLDDTLYINEEKITAYTIDTAKVLEKYNANEKLEIYTIIRFLKKHDIINAGLDMSAGLWFYGYRVAAEDDFNDYRFLTVINNNSDSFAVSALNNIIENKDGLILCQPSSTAQ